MNNLIIIRGNSGSGKSTIARKLQKQLGEGTMLISQDDVRIKILSVEDKKDNPAIELIYKLAMYGDEINANVIIEGILSNKKYSAMLHRLLNDFSGRSYVYYLDIPFEETLKRHASRSKKNDFGEENMRSWWREKDYLGVKSEKIIGSELTETEIAANICNDLFRDSRLQG